MNKITILTFVLFLASCTSRTILKKPDDIIPKDTMALLLTDLFIAKSAHNKKNLNNERNINYAPLIYTKYKIDSTRFIQSNYYYTSKLEEYNLIFTAVKAQLKEQKEVLEKKIKTDFEEIDIEENNLPLKD